MKTASRPNTTANPDHDDGAGTQGFLFLFDAI
jgi:hypothetical protein